jgi:hypothetical protein
MISGTARYHEEKRDLFSDLSSINCWRDFSLRPNLFNNHFDLVPFAQQPPVWLIDDFASVIEFFRWG